VLPQRRTINSTCRPSTGCGNGWSASALINQIRAFLLERGVAVRQGLRFLRAELPTTLATLFRRPYLAEIFVSVGQLIAAKAGPYERLEPPASTMTVALCLG
jgi:hypothetical protein